MSSSPSGDPDPSQEGPPSPAVSLTHPDPAGPGLEPGVKRSDGETMGLTRLPPGHGQKKIAVFVVDSDQPLERLPEISQPGTKTKMGDSERLEKQSLHSPAPVVQGRVTCRLVVAVMFAVMGSFAFGYNTGVINAPEAVIKSFMNSTQYRRQGEAMQEGTTTSLFALIVAIFAVGGCVGGFCAGWWANFFGRKNGLALNAAVGFIAAALMYFSRLAGAYEMIIVGRLLVGFHCGLYTGLTPMYLSEISAPNVRGALGVLHQLGVVCGLLLSQALGFPEALGNAKHWDILLGLTFAPCLVQVVLFVFCPESPRFLLITKKCEDGALKALKLIRGTDDVQYDIEEMKAEARQEASEPKVSLLSLFRNRSLRMPLIISVVMQLSQQLSGINGIFYYSASLYKGAGMEEAAATHATSGVGGVMVVMTLVTLPLMDRLGRRTLHLLGLGGMFVFSILITVALALREEAEWLKVGSIVVSLIYVVFFALGPGSVPWLIVAELFAQGPRPAAISLAVLVNWVANFLVGYTFPFLQKGLGDYTFLPFSALLLLFFLFTFFFVPETKGRTIEDITSTWRAPRTQPDADGGGTNGRLSTPGESSHLVSYRKTDLSSSS